MPIQIADWSAIEKFMMITEDYVAAAKQFNVKADTIRKRAKRHGWPLPSVIAAKVLALKKVGDVQTAQNGALIEQSAKTLAERGEAHAEMVFEKANAALVALKKFPVRNARDVELIDKVARRAAGMGNDDEGARISIIQLNEALDSHRTDDVIEAEIVQPGIPDTSSSDAPQLNDASGGDVKPPTENQGSSDA